MLFHMKRFVLHDGAALPLLFALAINAINALLSHDGPMNDSPRLPSSAGCTVRSAGRTVRSAGRTVSSAGSTMSIAGCQRGRVGQR